MKHECTSNCRKNECPFCPHEKDEQTNCIECDAISNFLSNNGKKTWNQLSKEEQIAKVKKAGSVSWAKKTDEQRKEQVAKMQVGRRLKRNK